MLDWFAGAMESAKTMKDIGQSLLTIRDESIIRDRVFALNNNLMELQHKMLEAQHNQMELLQRIKVLEDEREQVKQSANLMAQYIIKPFTTGGHAYVLKTEEGDPSRYFCTHCLETESVAVTLQGGRLKACPKCKNAISSAPRPPIRVSRY